MKPAPFRCERAASLEHAAELLGKTSGAKVLAGGQSLLPLMAFRQMRPELLVDINHVTGLAGHVLPEQSQADLTVGATTRQDVLSRWQPIDPAWLAVPQAARAVGNYVTRLRGTVAGSIAHADPAAELPAIFLLFDGELRAYSSSGERTLDGAAMFAGPHETQLRTDEVITEVRLASPPAGAISGFREVGERSAIAGVGVLLGVEEDRCTCCRIAMCGVASTPVRAREAEQLLGGSRVSEQQFDRAARAAAAAAMPRSDCHASARFRRALVEALVKANLLNIIRQRDANAG